MGLFGFGSKKDKSPPPVRPELVLPPVPAGRGSAAGSKVTNQKTMINNLLLEQQQKNAQAIDAERRAVNNVADRERQMQTTIAALRTKVDEQQAELDRAQRTEEDLHKALRLAAEKLSSVQTTETALRAEADDTRQQLLDTQLEVQTLRARLFGEKGVRIEPMAVGRTSTSAGRHEDDVIHSIVGGAAGSSGAEGRAAAARTSRQQLKRLLHFVKGQLAEDVSAFSGASGEEADDLTDGIGRRRNLVAKLEAALYELMGGAPVPRAAGGAVAAAQMLGPDGGGSGWQPRVHGHSLPRTVAVNEAGVRPILLTSGPASRWAMRVQPAAGAPSSEGALSARAGAPAADAPAPADGSEGDPIPWTCGTVMMLVVEAFDEAGSVRCPHATPSLEAPLPLSAASLSLSSPLALTSAGLELSAQVDADYDAVVLIDAPEHVSGKGFVRVSKGVGLVPLTSNKSGAASFSLQDGGFTRMEPPETLHGASPLVIAC